MKVLIVDDEPEISNYICRALQRARFAVDVADDAPTGIYRAAVNDYDIILCDYMMPDKDGIAVTRELRSRENNTPILMLTVVDDLQTKVRALDAGVDDFMCKPFAFEELHARIRALVRRRPVWQDDKLSVDDLTLDAKTYQAVRNGKKIALTRKEFMLLEYMMRNIDRVVPRSQLIEHVWDSAADPLTNSLEVHVRFLRKKIDEPWGQAKRLIHTVHGIGYKMGRL